MEPFVDCNALAKRMALTTRRLKQGCDVRVKRPPFLSAWWDTSWREVSGGRIRRSASQRARNPCSKHVAHESIPACVLACLLQEREGGID
jgi:hypothetical protein